MRDRQTKFFNQIFQKRRRPKSLDLERPYIGTTSDTLNNYLYASRQIGHTRTLKSALKNIDTPFYLVSISFEYSERLCKEINNQNAIPMAIELIGNKPPTYPVILDNSAYMRMCELYDNKLINFYHKFRNLIDELDEYHQERLDFVESRMKNLARLSSELRGELINEQYRSKHYKQRMNEEKKKKAYYKQSKQDFLNGLTLFQRIFKKFD